METYEKNSSSETLDNERGEPSPVMGGKPTLSMRSNNGDINADRKQNGYLVGFDDMEPDIDRMIREAHQNSFAILEKFDLIKVEFKQFKRDVQDQVN